MKLEYDEDRLHDKRRLLVDSIEVYSAKKKHVKRSALEYAAEQGKRPKKNKQIKQVMVCNIRHEYSNYEEILRNYKSLCQDEPQKDKRLVYHMIKNSTLEQIAQEYPYLKRQCKMQKIDAPMIKVVK